MKKFTKVSLIITAVLLVIGIGCVVVASGMAGGLMALHKQALTGAFDFGHWHFGDGVYYSSEDWDEELLDSSAFGLAGGHESSTETFAMADIHNITVNTDMADITFSASNDVENVTITMEMGYLKHYSVSLENGTLLVEYDTNNKTYESGPDIIITLPKQVDVEALNVTTALGDIEFEKMNLSAEKIELETSLGDVELSGLMVRCNMKLYSAMGDVKIEDGEYQGVEASTSMGEVKLEGTFQGDVSAESSMGDVKVYLDAEEAVYNFDLSTDMGDLHFNGQHYTDHEALGAERKFESSQALYDVTANTAMGDVEVETK